MIIGAGAEVPRSSGHPLRASSAQAHLELTRSGLVDTQDEGSALEMGVRCHDHAGSSRRSTRLRSSS
jgi:hypothetical protein